MRGTRFRRRTSCRVYRFSPARAGNSTASTRATIPAPVQPRACGELHSLLELRRYIAGSAPRVRGTLDAELPRNRQWRFSPARAGNSHWREGGTRSPAVQPRACGELSRKPNLPEVADGSAPRVRGTQRCTSWGYPQRRFSPARAGNSQHPATVETRQPVQPRACGELWRPVSWRLNEAGSAPRVRGTRWQTSADTTAVRFSPARAGNSIATSFPTRSRSVQPRACGELSTTTLPHPSKAGSAPRVRGTPCLSRLRSAARRFSPARAGNSHARPVIVVPWTVQPRACGELSAMPPNKVSMSGSAPRVRGTLRQRGVDRVRRRFSPARAGNSTS